MTSPPSSSITEKQLQMDFDAAVAKARVTTGVSNEHKKQIYALYKQATEGPLSEQQPTRSRPSMFDVTGRAKYDSWNALGNMSKEEAQKAYIDLIASL
jgi:acyl-CoA-binding protein